MEVSVRDAKLSCSSVQRFRLLRLFVDNDPRYSGQGHSGPHAVPVEAQEEIVVPQKINQGIDGAVHARQSATHLVGDVNVLVHLVARAVVLKYPRHQVKVPQHVVGDEADGEQDDQDDDQFQASLLQQGIDVGSGCEDHRDVAVAPKDDEQWDAESSNGPPDAVWKIIPDPVVGCSVIACVGGVFRRLVKVHVGNYLNQNGTPYQHAYPH